MHNTKTWLSQPVAHKHEIKSMGWIDGRLDGYADGSMEVDRCIDGRLDGKQAIFVLPSSPQMVENCCILGAAAY